MPQAAPMIRLCAAGHPPFRGERCPLCASERKRAHDARRQGASGRGYGAAWRGVREAFLKSRPKVCTLCGGPADPPHVDHVIPKRRGGPDSFWNLRVLCGPCHGRATVRHDGAFGNKTRPK